MRQEVKMNQEVKSGKDLSLDKIITTALQIPGVPVDRKKFLTEVFAGENVVLQDILDYGPVQANVPKKMLTQLAGKQILKRTSQSSAASFVAGIPGGLAMAAMVPADILQFFGMALRLAQELSYLYGAKDLQKNGTIDEEGKSRLLLYCGVMFEVPDAAAGVRVIASQATKGVVKALPQKALSKTFWYPMIWQIGKVMGAKVTKSTVAKGITKIIPVVGGVIAGGMNFASMLPMANRLQGVLDKACFSYTDEEFRRDLDTIEHMNFTVEIEHTEEQVIKEKLAGMFKRK